MKSLLLKISPIRYYFKGSKMVNDAHFQDVEHKTQLEIAKKPSRTDILNYLLSQFEGHTQYLEIGVRNPNSNFNKIQATVKYSVDPGVEFEKNPVDFQLTSDLFFEKISKNEILDSETKFDIIFIDGLHIADQVDKDISNALKFIKDDGFVVLHDCNPPSEWHARENYGYYHTPAHGAWNGTTWKAFLKWRSNPNLQSCCIDTDWGVGILSKSSALGKHIPQVNPFYEYQQLDENRKEFLNLIDFETLKSKLSN